MKFTQMIAGEVKYNRAAIMKEGWSIKKDGIKEGISIAWKMAREEKARIESEIEREAMLELEEMKLEEEFQRQIWEDAAIDPNFVPSQVEVNTIEEEETDPLFVGTEEELQREKGMLDKLEKMEVEDLYKMAEDLKGKNVELESMIARAIIRKKRKVVA